MQLLLFGPNLVTQAYTALQCHSDDGLNDSINRYLLSNSLSSLGNANDSGVWMRALPLLQYSIEFNISSTLSYSQYFY